MSRRLGQGVVTGLDCMFILTVVSYLEPSVTLIVIPGKDGPPRLSHRHSKGEAKFSLNSPLDEMKNYLIAFARSARSSGGQRDSFAQTRSS